MTDKSAFLRAAALGVVAGLRSMTPLALLSVLGSSLGRRARRDVAVARWLSSREARVALPLVAVGELVADKLPMTPSRLAPVPLAARAVVGMMAGAMAVRRRREPAALGALVGGACAVAAAFAGNKMRAAVVRVTSLPDPVVATAEDAVALGLGRAALA